MKSIEERSLRRDHSLRYRRTIHELGISRYHSKLYSNRFAEDYMCIVILDFLYVIGCKFVTIGYIENYGLNKVSPLYQENNALLNEMGDLFAGKRIALKRLPALIKLLIRDECWAILVNEKKSLSFTFEDDYCLWVHYNKLPEIVPELKKRYPYLEIRD